MRSRWASMTPLMLLRIFDIRCTQSHKATMAAGQRAVDVSQKLSFIQNHWRPSYEELLRGPNKRRLNKSHVNVAFNEARGWLQKEQRVVWSLLKSNLPFKYVKVLPGSDLVSSLWHYSVWKILSRWKAEANSHRKTGQMLTKGHVLFVCFAFLI